ncbi:MAG: DNA-binding response regulator [Deltaproteobacteria bacterium]|nr:MAG: DNA-binding response regulator [Deltaproteobacteria bacterium]RUA03649.1 MAG: DNA-binding response regulator [Deltaproteobacteria bacterium]
MPPIRAIIADDEKPLRDYLKRQLEKTWPELEILAEAENGRQALSLITSTHPDIAFLDIRMPGLSGIDVAAGTSDRCRIVFVTAYDQYAVDAFERSAIDYLLKPVTTARLEKTVTRLKASLNTALPSNHELSKILTALTRSGKKNEPAQYLNWIRVQYRDGIRLIPVGDVCYFKASDKYTIVRTRDHEALIRKTVAALARELDPSIFWQIHRGTIVNVTCIDKVSRTTTGKRILKLKCPPETLTISRTYAHLFKQM